MNGLTHGNHALVIIYRGHRGTDSEIKDVKVETDYIMVQLLAYTFDHRYYAFM